MNIKRENKTSIYKNANDIRINKALRKLISFILVINCYSIYLSEDEFIVLFGAMRVELEKSTVTISKIILTI